MTPPPPDGVILPAVGRPRQILAGDKTTSYRWKAIYEASDDDVKSRRDSVASAITNGMDTGDVATLLYAAQVRAAGIEVSPMVEAGFSYMIQGGSLAVIVRSDDDFHQGDPSGFTISVGPAGG